MLYTLIPSPERKALHREYARRTAIVILFAASLVGTIGIGSLFPSFIRAATEAASAKSQLDLATKSKNKKGLSDIQQQVAMGQSSMIVLTSGIDRTRLSFLVESIVKQRDTVRINSISLNSVSSSSAEAVISGSAPTRDSLVSFKTRLESSGVISVDLPVSELAKSTNVPFSINLKFRIP